MLTRSPAPPERKRARRRPAEPRPQVGAWRFVGAVSGAGAPPEFGLPEIAFAGRSNVGKSSLINALTRTRALARTSSTPGRTQQINFFAREPDLVFVDLPGYGFARVPLAVRAAWKPLVERYLRGRDRLRAIVVIVDLRRGLEPDDLQLLDFARACGRACVVVATKADKLKQSERRRALGALAEQSPDAVAVSATSGEGLPELWKRLAGLAGVR